MKITYTENDIRDLFTREVSKISGIKSGDSIVIRFVVTPNNEINAELYVNETPATPNLGIKK